MIKINENKEQYTVAELIEVLQQVPQDYLIEGSPNYNMSYNGVRVRLDDYYKRILFITNPG